MTGRRFWLSATYWGLVGACAAFGLAAAFTYGPMFFLAAGLLLVVGLVVRVIDKRASPAAIAGACGGADGCPRPPPQGRPRT